MKITRKDNTVTIDGQGETYYYLGDGSIFEFDFSDSENPIKIEVLNFKFHYAQKGDFWTKVKTAYEFFKNLK